MKLRIKTAHGYLSFQPPDASGTVVLQYRAEPGAWEELLVEAWDLPASVPIDPDTPEPPPPGNDDYPFGISPTQSASYVQAIKDALLSRGVSLNGPCGAFEIVRNVALGLRDTGAGVLFKDSGNMCQERSTDIVCYKDFNAGATRLVDVLSDAGGQNEAMWMEKGPEENVEMDRWRDATESSGPDY